MKVAVLVVVLSLSLFAFYSNAQQAAGDFLTAFPARFSWETIFANYTSYLDEIDAHNNTIYVSGEGVIHEIVEEPFEFSYERDYFSQHRHRYIDFRVFEHRNETYIIGPVEASSSRDAGIGHPIQIATKNTEDEFVFLFPVQIAAIAATNMFDHVVAYGAGWVIGDHECSRNGVGFAVFRMFVHPSRMNERNATFITMNNFTNDYVCVPDFTGYTEYTRSFKPWIYHSNHTEQVILVDPATSMVYRISAPNSYEEGLKVLAFSGTAFSSTNITSAAFDYFTGNLVIGTRGHGNNPGTIMAINVFDPVIPTRDNAFRTLFTRTLDRWESNPKAILIHRHSIYVGFAGGSYLLHLNLTNYGSVVGYATVPYYAQNVHDIHASDGHVYVITNEQHSKVLRTEHKHFCSTPCDSLYGYCNDGQCACHPGHVLNTSRWAGHCSPDYTTDITEEKKVFKGSAGEAVLGVLFALFFVAAVLGWVVVWRNASGKPLPFGLGKSRYSALNGEERESFLSE